MKNDIINLFDVDKFDMTPLFLNGDFGTSIFIDIKKNKIGHVADFGTLFLGWDLASDNIKQEAMELSGRPGETNVFVAPMSWAPAHVAKTFGLFPSVGQAAKNGWSREQFEVGCHELTLKIKKAKGILWVHKLDIIV